jgi:hypothetical protein
MSPTVHGFMITVSKQTIVTYGRDHFRQNCHDRMAAECQIRLIGLSIQGHATQRTMAARYLHLIFVSLRFTYICGVRYAEL